MRTIAFMNQKGGVGKTTSAVNVAAGLSRLGRRVLLIDMDPQAHATLSLGLPADSEKTTFELLDGTATAADVIVDRDGLAVMPSGLQLAGAEIQLIGAPGREMLLRSALDGVDFEYILIDCPPSIGLLTMNALTVATSVYVPLKTEYLPIQGIDQLKNAVDLIRRRLNPQLAIDGVFGTFYDARRNIDRDVMDYIRQVFGDKVLKTAIRSNVALAEAPVNGKTIFEHAPTSHGAEDFAALCQEIIDKEGAR